MEKIKMLFALVVICLFGIAGCKKEDTGGPPQEFYGVKVDWRKLETLFTNANPEVQSSVMVLSEDYRYAQFSKALADLDKLANDPSLTAPQKKLVTELTEQTKQVIAKAPPEPAR